MTSKSWAVTLTPLILAVLQIAQSMMKGEPLTQEQITLVISCLVTFLGAGYLGVKHASKKQIRPN